MYKSLLFLFLTISLFVKINLNGQGFSELDVGLSELTLGESCIGDYDGDGDFDIYSNGELYKNESYTFISINEPFFGGNAKWIDYDNDGDIDLFTANKGINIFKNDGTDSFAMVNNNIDTLNVHSFDFGDFDNDGDIDIILIGDDYEGEPISQIYKNEGGNFININQSLISNINNGNIKFVDFNKDGLLDIFCYGLDFNGNILAIQYKNTKEDSYIIENSNFFKSIDYREINYSDIDNNGELDLILSGWHLAFPFNKIYKNYNSLFFETQLIPGEYGGKTYISDFDNDGRRDIFFESNFIGANMFLQEQDDSFTSTYTFESGYISIFDFNKDLNIDILINNKFYVNNSLLNNTKPNPPTFLDAVFIGNEIQLFWNKGSDNETPNNSLFYNIAVGETTESVEIISPNADILTGNRYISNYGNVYMDTTYTLRNLKPGKYYWRVQSIDACFIGSNFSKIDSFEVVPLFTKEDIIVNKPIIDLGDIDNDGDIDLFSNYGYFLNEIDTFIYVQPELPIRFIFDYNNDNNIDIVSNYNILKNNIGSFEEDTSILDYFGNDYLYFNDDGFYDIVAKDYKLLINHNGDSVTFNKQMPDLLEFKKIVNIENNNYQFVSINGIYFQDHDDIIFVNNIFPQISTPRLKIADLNNDNLIDLIIHGLTNLPDHNNISDIYINTGDKFQKKEFSDIRGIRHGNSAIGDYNNDGLSDVLIGGESAVHILELYTNTGDFSFNKNCFEFEGIITPQIFWLDYNNDGNLDFIVYGLRQDENGSVYVLEIYKNNGNYPNDPPTAPTNLRAERNGYGIIFGWNEATDPQSTEGGLSYNLRVGTTSGGVDIMSPMSDVVTGYRRIPKMGNCQMNLGWRLDTLPEGTYYWAVQAIDQSFMGGAWSEEQTFTITVIRANFEADTVCLGDTTRFTDISLTGGTEITDWEWNFGDDNTSTAQNPTHVYAQSGNYEVRLIALGGDFSDTITKTVVVKPIPVTYFSATEVCVGTETAFTNLTNTDSVTVSIWNWDFGDSYSSTFENPGTHGYLNAGSYEVELTVTATNGCSDTYLETIHVGKVPNAQISLIGNTSFCNNDSATLFVTSDTSFIYQWKLNNVNLVNADSNVYYAKTTGNYKVIVTNTIGECADTSTAVTISAIASPPAYTIITEGEESFCEGESVVLKTTQNDNYIYQWYINEGAIGTNSNTLVAEDPGTYKVKINNEIGCGTFSSNTVTVTVNDKATAPSIQINGETNFCQGDSLTLSVTNNPDLSYQWYKNNAPIANVTTTRLVVKEVGEYFLEVENASGCKDRTNTQIIGVYEAPPKPTIVANDELEICQGDSITLSFEEIEGCSSTWIINGISQQSNQYTIYAKQSGSYAVEVENTNGCTSASINTLDVKVNPSPAVTQIGLSGSPTFCEGGSVILSVTEETACSYQWYNENGNIANATSASYTATTTGEYGVNIENEYNCAYTPTTKQIIAATTPPEQTIVVDGNTLICPSEVVQLSVMFNENYSYQWSLDGIEIYDAINNSLNTNKKGKYTVEISNYDCSIETGFVEITHKSALPKPDLYAQGPDIWILACSNDSAQNFRWYYNGELIVNATEAIYFANQNLGEYYVTINDGGECWVPSDIVTIPLSTTEVKALEVFGQIKIYPNPTPGVFTIEMDNEIIGTINIRISNTNARELFNIKHNKTTRHFQTQMDLSGQGEGMYFIEFRFEDNKTVKKLIVE